jgi:broad specificity phosphatase PhoE
MRAILIRHAEARRAANPNSGRALDDLGLTSSGCDQAHALADYLRTNKIALGSNKFIVSPLRRAVETAEIVSASLGRLEFRFQKTPEFAEIGELPGQDETVPQGFTRVRNTMTSLAAEGDDVTLVITHAGFIVASMLELLSMATSENRARLAPDYTGLTSWRFQSGVWHLERYNLLPQRSRD